MALMNAALDTQTVQITGRKNADMFRKRITIFCDFDGPIVDVSARYYSTYKLGLADTQLIYQAKGETLPIQVLSKEQFWLMKQNRVPDPEIAKNSGLQGEQINLFLQRVSEIVNQPELLHKDKMQPGINWAIALLHSCGCQLVVVTLRRQYQAIEILKNYGLARLFRAIYGTEDDDAAYQNYASVKKQLLAKAIAELSLCSEEIESAWMIGDTEADIEAAKSLEISTIALTCGIRSRFYLTQFQPNYIYSDLLSAAHHLLKVTQLAPT